MNETVKIISDSIEMKEKLYRLKDFENEFKNYVDSWNILASYKPAKIWRILFPIGFFLEMKNLKKMEELTQAWNEYLDAVGYK